MNEFGDRPIGVFDSGLGGLSVLKTLLREFPNENFIYIGDTARLPYGSKSADTIQKYVEQLCHALIKQKVKALIVACNSASSVVLAQKEFEGLPLYNVIEPGSEEALRKTESLRVGIIGTRTTIHQAAYPNTLKKLNPDVEVFQQACPLLVPLVEEGLEDDPITNLITYRYLSPLLQQNIDTLILGCTHYPIMMPAIRKVTGNHVNLVDSAQAVAKVMRVDFESGRLMKNKNAKREFLKIFATDVTDGFQTQTERILHPERQTTLEWIDLTSN